MHFLEIMIVAAPELISTEYMLPALQHYSSLLAPATRGHSFSSNSLPSLLKVTVSAMTDSICFLFLYQTFLATLILLICMLLTYEITLNQDDCY